MMLTRVERVFKKIERVQTVNIKKPCPGVVNQQRWHQEQGAYPLYITIRYLIVLALSSSSHVQFKGLFDQPSLSLPLSLRVVRGICCAVALIPAEKGKKFVPTIM